MKEPLAPRRRILMVDNNHQLRAGLGFMLSRAGFEVEHAVDGNEALALHRQQPFDLVIAEVLLSDKDGFETLRELRRHPSPPKFIAVSEGNRVSADLYLRMAQHLGADTVLAKPFQPEELLSVVRLVLGTP